MNYKQQQLCLTSAIYDSAKNPTGEKDLRSHKPWGWHFDIFIAKLHLHGR